MTRKSSEPACRVCRCTEHNACDGGCSWVEVEKGSPPLCSACAGTDADMHEAMTRISKLIEINSELAPAIARAALRRWKVRYASVIDKTWGGR